MLQAVESMLKVGAQIEVPAASVQLVQFQMTDPADNILLVDDTYWIDFSLTPRPHNARGRYRDHWSPARFERLGKLFILPVGEALQARSDGGEAQTSLLCHLNPEQIQKWFDGELVWTDPRLEACLDIRDGRVNDLLVQLTRELQHPGFAAQTMVELLTSQLALELSRYYAKNDARSYRGGLATWRLRLIDERLADRPEVPSLTELAELCGLSSRQLTRGFRQSRGCSIGEYLAEHRLQQARELLMSGQSVKAIAYTLGFSSPSAFCYAFRRDTGESPGQYRQRMRCERH